MSSLELGIAWRYLRSRRGSKLLSFISLIAIGGVIVGVSALIVVMGVMNGLQRDLREKILIGSPDVRVLPYGDDLKIDDWRSVLRRVRSEAGVVAAAPFVQTQGVVNAGHDYREGAQIVGIEPDAPGKQGVTTIRQHASQGDFTFIASDGQPRGVVLGRLLAQKLNAFPADTITVNPSFLEEFLRFVVLKLGADGFRKKFRFEEKGDFNIEENLQLAIEHILRNTNALVR